MYTHTTHPSMCHIVVDADQSFEDLGLLLSFIGVGGVSSENLTSFQKGQMYYIRSCLEYPGFAVSSIRMTCPPTPPQKEKKKRKKEKKTPRKIPSSLPDSLVHLEQELEQDGGEGGGGGGVGEKGVWDELEGVVGLDAIHQVPDHGSEDLLVHSHAHHGELGGMARA